MSTKFSISLYTVFYSIALVTFVSAAPFLIAASETKSSCDSVLIQAVEYDVLDYESSLAYLSQIDQATWDKKKTSASFIGKWTGFLGPMSGDFSYAKMDQARKRLFERKNYSIDTNTAIGKLRRYVTDKQVEAWLTCKLDEKNRSVEKTVTGFSC